MNTLSKFGTALSLAVLSVPAFADDAGSADVSAATGALTSAATAIGLIGVGMLAAASAGIVYRWVTAFLVK